MLLKDKVAVITGSANGIGRASALLFAREGAKVMVSDIEDDTGKQVVAEIRKAGGQSEYCHADVRVLPDLENLVKATVKAFGRLNIYWHHAGGAGAGPIEKTTEHDFDNQIAMNVKAGFFGAKYAIPEIAKAGGGSILFTASFAGLKPSPYSPTYSIAKVGLVMLARSLALSQAKHNIRVNCVCPGATMTRAMTQMFERDPIQKERITQIVSQAQNGRFMTPEEMANAGLFLASDMASGITGLSLPVDLGRHAA